MKAKLFCYTLQTTNAATRNKFRKELLGHNDTSHNGHYQYRRDGVLERIWHEKPIRSVIIVKEQDAKKIETVMQKYSAKYYAYTILRKA